MYAVNVYGQSIKGKNLRFNSRKYLKVLHVNHKPRQNTPATGKGDWPEISGD